MKKDVEAAGLKIRKGDQIYIGMSALCNNPDQWQSPEKFIPDEKVTAYGEIKNFKIEPGNTKYCLDTLSKENVVGVYPCQNGGGNQVKIY